MKQTQKRFISHKRFSNCWLLFLSLLIRFRLSGVVIVWRWRPHLIGITHRGNYVHLKNTHECDILPVMFFGRVQVFRARDFWYQEKTCKLTWR